MPSEANKAVIERDPSRLSAKKRRRLQRGKPVDMGICPDKAGRRIKETFPDVELV
jgi:hypothetical protein